MNPLDEDEYYFGPNNHIARPREYYLPKGFEVRRFDHKVVIYYSNVDLLVIEDNYLMAKARMQELIIKKSKNV